MGENNVYSDIQFMNEIKIRGARQVNEKGGI